VRGLTLTAVAEEPTTAISLGISVKRAVTLAWMMGSVIAIAGAMVLLSGRSITVQTADLALARCQWRCWRAWNPLGG
jgi:branched-chain amino acid transport system permease protein